MSCRDHRVNHSFPEALLQADRYGALTQTDESKIFERSKNVRTIKGLAKFAPADFADLIDGPNTASIPVRAGDRVESISGVRASMKFLPPEDEIRAQLRELTSKTRRLRTDLQGLINDRGRSASAFSRDRRLRAKPDPSPPIIPPSDQSPSSHLKKQPVEPKRPKARKLR